MKVHLVECDQNILLGKVVNPFGCCELKLNIFNASNDLRYTIVGSCCQCGVICQGPCCQEVELQILNVAAEQVGTLRRVKASILQNVVETVANFTVTFPQHSNGPDRALLIAATIMLDYTYFEKKSKGTIHKRNNGFKALENK